MGTLGDLASRRNNNFNLIRMLAATAVLVSHSYPLSWGSTAVEPLSNVLGISLGELAVITFFCVSGFFISMSRERAPSNIDFFSARFLRIYPGLSMALLLAVFMIGITFTTRAVPDYLSNGKTYSYLSNNLLLFNMKFQLPGLFQDNPYPGINGSLWTLFYEVMLYVLVGVLGALSFFGTSKRFLGFLMVYFVVYLGFKLLGIHTTLTEELHRMRFFFTWSFPFVIGMALYRYRNNVELRPVWLVPLLIVAASALHTAYFFEGLVLAWTYLIFYLGFSTHSFFDRYNQLGDYSYGVYIYAFPVQEILAHQFKGIEPLVMMALTFPVALIAAVLSWHLLEKPCMSMRRTFAAHLSASFSTLKAYCKGQPRSKSCD
jgi:peptidoglycan/LPS O-acetylase OafA/YrhL